MFLLRIIDHFEVSIRNIHLRYEDGQSIPGKVFATGIHIPSINLSTTDQGWVVISSDSKEHGATEQMRKYKLGTLENFGVYWDANTTSTATLDHSGWEQLMRERIIILQGSRNADGTAAVPTSKFQGSPATTTKSSVTSSNQCTTPETNAASTEKNTTKNWGIGTKNKTKGSPDASSSDSKPPEVLNGYIISPCNCVTMKIVHTEAPTDPHATPKVDIAVECSALPLRLEKEQFAQIMLLRKALRDLQRKRVMAVYRPGLRPTACPRLWWHYAYKLVSGKNFSVFNKV